MLNRRQLFGAATAAAVFQDNALQRAQAAAQTSAGRPADSVAVDEDFWLQIRHAFTVDRNMINLNNGGVSPSPKMVMETEKRLVEIQNMGPAHYMWRILEPGLEHAGWRANGGRADRETGFPYPGSGTIE